MIRASLAFLCVALLAGCGGGGVAAPEPLPVIAMSTDVVSGLSPTYKAIFDCRADVTVNGLRVNVTGTYTLETTPTTVVSPINALSGRLVKNAIFLSAAGQSFDVEIREFIYVDSNGRWWSLGGEDTEGHRSWWSGTPAAVYPPPVNETVTGRILNLDSTMTVGQLIDVPAIDALSDDDLITVLFTRSSTRSTVSIEVVDTALGRYETYRSNSTETLDLNDGSGSRSVDFIRWERPEMGLIQLHAEGIDISYDTYDVTVHTMDCVLTSYTP